MSNRYHLEVKEGKKEVEEGYFFGALPFTIMTEGQKIHCTLKKGSKGKVVYVLEKEGTVLFELEHPDYAPDIELDALAASGPGLQSVFAALVYVGITVNKAYKAALSGEIKTVSYSVIQ